MMKLFLGFLLVLSIVLAQAQNGTVPASSTTPATPAGTHTATHTATQNLTVGVKNGSGRMDCWAALLPLATAAPLLLHRLCGL